ncbi:diguanylate cyclase [Massilia sp. HP4]|uniref:sensor domain-containing diguanylate cyclase n=1 Tax=Massilia sp. HP4 TaxID=2562316 RepID=UPI0010C01033|nr:diguanylate cyclase [Massilia sp. HP4]
MSSPSTGTAPTALVQDVAFVGQLMESLSVPVFVLDTDARVMIWNRACEQLTGVPAPEVLGTGDHWRSFYEVQRPTLADMVLKGRRDEPRPARPRGLTADADALSPLALSIESWCDMPRAGRRRYLAADASPIFNAQGRLSAVVETLRDLTDEKMAQIALEQLATRDGLTGLANRRCFDDTLHAEWNRALRQMQPLSLLMVDVDNFKAYNDAHGHLGGDECLKRVARAVASEMRANDLVARYGGEEFAVILPNQSLKGAAIVAERIRCRVEQLQLPCRFAAGHVTVSIGAATAIAGPDNHASQLVAIADAALYRAKHLGRNRISLPMTEAA